MVSSIVARQKALLNRDKAIVASLDDTPRILNLPAVDYDYVDNAAVSTCLSRPGGALRLNKLQAQMLTASQEAQGGVFMVGTGHGKAWTALLVGSVVECKRVLLFAPSSTLPNLRKEKMRIALHFYLHPQIDIHSIEELQKAVKEGEKDVIEELVFANEGRPEDTIIVVDEAHLLKNYTDSARGRRFLRAKLQFPELRVFLLSGSMTEQSIKESAHLSWMALGSGSPFPSEWDKPKGSGRNAANLLNSWSACLDVKGEPKPSDWSAFQPVWAHYYPDVDMWSVIGLERKTMARAAFQQRLRTTSGVVLSSESSLQGCRLVLKGVRVEMPQSLVEEIDNVISQGIDPDGNPLPDTLATARVVRQLAQGFFYVWDWPQVDGKPQVDTAWLTSRSAWKAHVRRQIQTHARTGYDSELLVSQHVQRLVENLAESPLERTWVRYVGRSAKDEGDLSRKAAKDVSVIQAWLAAGGTEEKHEQIFQKLAKKAAAREASLLESWLAWSSRHKHKPQPPTRAVWRSYFLIDDAIERARKCQEEGHHPILWYDYDAVGQALSQRGKIPAYGAGTTPSETELRTMALSLNTHSEGKNLQLWHRNIYLSPRASNKKWEQSLGRTYRQGQTADQVDALVYLHHPIFEEAIKKSRIQADYVQIMFSNAQKLLYAHYEDIKVYNTGADLFDANAVDSDDEVDDTSE